MPSEYEFRESDPPPKSEKYPTKWQVRELRDGKPWGNWRRLHCTPRGAYYLMAKNRKRIAYDGPEPS